MILCPCDFVVAVSIGEDVAALFSRVPLLLVARCIRSKLSRTNSKQSCVELRALELHEQYVLSGKRKIRGFVGVPETICRGTKVASFGFS